MNVVRRSLALLTAASAAVTLVACDGPGAAADQQYVALGDSYTAGPLIGDPDGDDGCVRSLGNYPHLLAEQAGLSLEDVSCSGATTEDVVGEQELDDGRSVDPQIEAVDEDTDLVTIGLGLNDFNLSTTVFITCQQQASVDPLGAPCTQADAAAGSLSTHHALARITDRVVGVIDVVRDRAPQAEIVLVGYPTIFPTTGTCSELGVAAGDVPFVRGVVDSVNASLAAAAAQRGARFLDTATPSRGHDICADEPWIAGNVTDPDRPALIWHPYAEEQELVADLLSDLVP